MRCAPSGAQLEELVAAVQDSCPVKGFTHDYYRYPARFSPRFARAAIRTFTSTGGLVLDPFAGGGTTLVEAATLERRAVGTDISPLAVFLAHVKTRVYSDADLSAFVKWADGLSTDLNAHEPSIRPKAWMEQGYLRNLNGRHTWPIRRCLETAVSRLGILRTQKQRGLARCLLLKTGQWALDGRREVPRVEQFRQKLREHAEQMASGAREFREAAAQRSGNTEALLPICVKRAAEHVRREPALRDAPPPQLILTSPPYPGVHVLYHRWQVLGRKETAAPFWVANCLDGQGDAYYTMGGRHKAGLNVFFERMRAAFTCFAQLSDTGTVLVQLVGFSQPDEYLPKYLGVLRESGFREMSFVRPEDSRDGRLWRNVPNRRWHADQKGNTASSREVVLVHELGR